MLPRHFPAALAVQAPVRGAGARCGGDPPISGLARGAVAAENVVGGGGGVISRSEGRKWRRPAGFRAIRVEGSERNQKFGGGGGEVFRGVRYVR